MKKLFLFAFFALSFSQTMAMGYPQNVLLQRRVLIQQKSSKAIVRKAIEQAKSRISTEKVVSSGIFHLFTNVVK